MDKDPPLELARKDSLLVWMKFSPVQTWVQTSRLKNRERALSFPTKFAVVYYDSHRK